MEGAVGPVNDCWLAIVYCAPPCSAFPSFAAWVRFLVPLLRPDLSSFSIFLSRAYTVAMNGDRLPELELGTAKGVQPWIRGDV